MRTMLRSKVTLLFLSCAVLLTIAGVALADVIVPDGDSITTNGNQAGTSANPIDLGTVAPGGVKTPQVSFELQCQTKKHVDLGQKVNLGFSLANSTVPGGSLTATSAVVGGSTGIPASWPEDDEACPNPDPSPIQDGGNSTVTITAPTSPGSYTYEVAYNSSFTPVQADDGDDLQGNGRYSVFYKVTVANPTQNTTTTVTSNNNPSTYGNPVTFTATVTGTSSNPSGVGNVTFKDGGTAISPACTNVSLTGNQATCTTSGLSAAASPHSITADYSGGTGYNASPTSSALSQVVNKRSVTASIAAANKPYDQTTAATITGCSLNSASGNVGVLAGDSSNLGCSASNGAFADKNVGTGKSVSANVSLTGSAAGNYQLSSNTASTTANITARDLTVDAHGVNKTYDGNADATVTFTDDRLSGDVFTVDYTSASFNNKNVGTGKPVSVSGISLSGTDAGNYNLTNTTDSTTANITARDLTVDAHGVNKTYDGNADATVTFTDDRVSGDVFTVDYTSASFNNKNVGTGKPVSVSGISLSGTDAGNYNLTNTTDSTTANITARDLTVDAHGVNKTYDGNADATVTFTDDRVSGDVFTVDYTSASFNNKNVGTGKPVSVSGISLSGTDAGNYNLTNTTDSTTANITARDLTVDAHGVNKTYDGNADATVTFTDDRVSGDVFTIDYTASFNNKNVGTGKPVSVSGISLSGTDAGNYNLLNTTDSTTANITARDLTVDAHGVNKTYDGNADATVTFTDDRVSGDVFTVDYTASFNNKNVGTGKPVSVSGISLSGTDAGNYNLLNTTDSTTANITQLGITGSFTAANKVYDGNNSATVLTRSLTAAITGDNVSLTGGTATFNNELVGNGKTVTLAGATLSGTDSTNYTLTSVSTTTANITAWNAQGYGFYSPVDDRLRRFNRAQPCTAASGYRDAVELCQGRLHCPPEVQRLRRHRGEDEPERHCGLHPAAAAQLHGW